MHTLGATLLACALKSHSFESGAAHGHKENCNWSAVPHVRTRQGDRPTPPSVRYDFVYRPWILAKPAIAPWPRSLSSIPGMPALGILPTAMPHRRSLSAAPGTSSGDAGRGWRQGNSASPPVPCVAMWSQAEAWLSQVTARPEKSSYPPVRSRNDSRVHSPSGVDEWRRST